MLLPVTYQRAERGGLARRATMIKEIRGQVTHALALVATGDIFARSPWHTKLFGMPKVEAMNAMGYDVMCVGNNDFKATDDSADAQRMMLALLRRSQGPCCRHGCQRGHGRYSTTSWRSCCAPRADAQG